ncbi:transglutaminase-like domain-containing protein [Micromonospora sagamiensis]|uniref:Uncharacterized protein DUF4129 n=1 Tax=Micromonospora sagamiensis TaxID=47875 RepID=A0A562W971_9ACTN|nr:transglutaminase-like domain-containing protein [Micromonospora sagamiensis]TWJ26658.1 uncharacterized protein DUF4129 [Micromonospora sagamiensis]BCL14456.1 hypothetical protein GCM10017556_21950 [Micromonospora sagamiensis]
MRLFRVLVAVSLGALGGFAFGPAFGGMSGAFAVAVAVAWGAAALAGVAAVALPRTPPTVVAVVGAVAVASAATVATGSGVGLVHGPWQLLTGAVPAEPTGPPLAAAAVVAGWSALAAGLLAAYAARPLSAALPPLACLVLALALGAAGPPLPAWYALPLVALLVTLLVAGRAEPPPPGVLAGGALTAVVAVAAAALLGPGAPSLGRPPADVRGLVAAPVLPRSGVSPLQQYLALRDGSRVLRLTGTSSRPGTLLRMATLTRFDGVYWTVGGDFRRAGKKLPAAREPYGRRVTVAQQVRVDAGELDWLVTAGRPTEVSRPGLGVDEATGDVAVPDDTAPPAAYSASSTITEATLDEILVADPVPVAGSPLPALPPQVRAFLDRAVAGQPAASDQILALYRAFTGKAGGFRYDQSAEAAGGHGYFRIQRLLTDKRGTSEQYASAFAALVRHLGYDARVVMGLRPRYDGDAFVAEGRDVDAWVEVHFADLGWIGVDPSPRANPIGTRPDAPRTISRSAPLDDPLQEAEQPPPPGEPEVAVDDREESSANRRAGRTGTATPLVLGLVAALVVLLVAAAPTAKAVRRLRRRHAPSDRLAVIGAWRETLDRLQEAGVRVGPAQTTGEVVRIAGSLGGLPALAATVDRAAYAPEEPGPAMRADAWAAAARVHGQVRSSMPLTRRLRALLDPRPLRR